MQINNLLEKNHFPNDKLHTLEDILSIIFTDFVEQQQEF